MILTETLYGPAGESLGKIKQDLFKALVTFEPSDGSKRLAGRKWRRENDCRRDVLNHYRGKSK